MSKNFPTFYRLFKSKWLKRILLLLLLGLLACEARLIRCIDEGAVIFLFVAIGTLLWSFWDERQKK